MSTLKKVREQPLLTMPPGERPWWVASEEDKRLIAEMFKSRRRILDDIVGVGMEAQRMMALGIPVELTVEEKTRLKGKFQGTDRVKESWATALTAYVMDSLGLKPEHDERDLRLWRLQLDFGRDSRLGRQIGWMHVILRRFGDPQEVTDGDVKTLMEDIGRFREGDRWVDAAECYWLLHELGRPQKPTSSDEDAFRREADKWRHVGGGTDLLTDILFYLDKIMPKTGEATQKMPPLKEYRK